MLKRLLCRIGLHCWGEWTPCYTDGWQEQECVWCSRRRYARERHEEIECTHDFFKCQVPAGDSCVAIYHQVCAICRWDDTKGIIMPNEIWQGWAVPQIEKRAEC